MNFLEYTDEELLEAGREALKLEKWDRAKEFLAEYFDRHMKTGQTLPAAGLASFALSLGHTKEVQRGIELCKRALGSDSRNPYIHWCMATLHLLDRSRRHAIEAVDRGLRSSPDNFMLIRLRKKLGVRRPPLFPFLKRDHSLNVRLGKWMQRLRGNRVIAA